MHRGFNLKIDNKFFENGDYYNSGFLNYMKNKSSIETNIENYMEADGSLDGEKITKEWFPDVKADVFISHSHTDEKLAINLAGWLYENFKLVSFIDSCVWGYSEELLRIIDNKYCYDKDTGNYRYVDRNFSTSHVHMMLSMSLMSMIDKTECIIFLNTENSIQTAGEVIRQTTKSPWIFSELETTKLIQKKPVSAYREEKIEKRAVYENFSLQEKLSIMYRGDTGHLSDLNDVRLLRWALETYKYNKSHPLDILYNMIPIKGDK